MFLNNDDISANQCLWKCKLCQIFEIRDHANWHLTYVLHVCTAHNTYFIHMHSWCTMNSEVSCFHTELKILNQWTSQWSSTPICYYFYCSYQCGFFFNHQMNVSTAFWVSSASEMELTPLARGVFCLGHWKTTEFFSFYYTSIYLFSRWI